MNVAPVAPPPTPGRAAEPSSPAASAFGDLLETTSAADNGQAIAGAPNAQVAATPTVATSATATDPALAQPTTTQASAADHVPPAPAPRDDKPAALPALSTASTDAGEAADDATPLTPAPAAAAAPVSPGAPASSTKTDPAQPVIAAAGSPVSPIRSWQAALAGDATAPKVAGDGNRDDGDTAPSNSDKTKSERTGVADPTPTNPQQPQPVMLAAMPAATTIQSALADRVPGTDAQGAPSLDGTESSAGGQPATLALPETLAAVPPHGGSDNLPPLLASQMPGAAIAPPAGQTPSYAAAPQASPVVAAEPGRMGRDIGVEIARHVAAGRDEVMIRLSPAEMGRIDVRLSFDSKGSLHAAVSADSPQALDMLRRDAGELGRSLADAGIRTDSSSFSFGSRDGSAGQFAHQQQGHSGGDGRQRQPGLPFRDADAGDVPDAALSPYRQLRASGRVNLMA